MRDIRRVAVLGAGTMGAQIAALIAERGLECDLLDLSVGAVDTAKQKLLTMRPRVFDDRSALERIRAGSFDADLERLEDADWVIEAIVERAQPKLELWERAARYVRADAILSSNTSGIPIFQISRALPPELRERFLGTHFFNPPRYLRLLEVIPTDDSDRSAVAEIGSFAEEVLGKGVVTAHDVPGFITNRIGCYYFLAAMRAADEFGLTPDEVDAISGPLMARSNSATFRTIDLVGVDILLDICDNTSAAVAYEEEKLAFQPPEHLREMRRRGWLGNKSGRGFYERKRIEGRSHILVLNTEEMRYHELQQGTRGLLSDLQDMDDSGERLQALVGLDNAAGGFAWRTLSQLMAFSAAKVGEVADDIISIDRAMRWGFNWELGPFETWDALGVADTFNRMRSDGMALPGWVVSIAEHDGSFYRREGDVLLQATPPGEYVCVPD